MKRLIYTIIVLLSCLGAQALEPAWYVDDRQVWRLEESAQADSSQLDYYHEFLIDNEADGIGIQYPVFEEIKGAQLRAMLPMLQRMNLSDSLQLIVNKGLYRKNDCWDVYFYPFICRDKKYYRLLSFEWKIQDSKSKVVQDEGFASVANFTSLRSGNAQNAADRYAANSVLSKGNWQKISVTENGVYKLSFDELKKMGIDPQKAQVYGYGGHLLAEDFSDASRPYIDDLPKVPMYKNDAEKYILFYANGLRRWIYDAKAGMYVRELNHYSDKAYYFVSESEDGQMLMQEALEAGEATTQSQHYTAFILHENDWVNLGTTGRECFGESFISASQQHFKFDIGEHFVSDETSQMMVEFVVRNSLSTSCQVYLNDHNIGVMSFPRISPDDNYNYGDLKSLSKSFKANTSIIDIALDYRNMGYTPKAAYLDKITLNVRKKLSGKQPVLLFRDPLGLGYQQVKEYQISEAGENHIVLDISKNTEPRIVPTYMKDGKFCFRASADNLKEFALIDLKAGIPSPKKEGKVDNQNLHALAQQDFVIISHKDFLQQAEQLAQAHREQDGLRCVVVEVEQVYNEFSSGTPDATAYRRLMKMFYDRAQSEEDMPESLLLFGDGVYDNRLATNQFAGISNKPNKLLTYQSKESLSGTSSFVSDDYFAMLDDSEGKVLETSKMDIGVGRFPVRTRAEAEVAINKSINYLKNKDKGIWKNQLCFLSDDGDNNSHIGHADALAEIVRAAHPEYIINKIYIDAFDRENSASGSKTPEANRQFKQLLSNGLLMLNYSGHGSTNAWTAEGLLSITDIRDMKNTRLPLWVTATCNFSRYDDSETSGGEMVFLNANGGAFAMVTTSRAVYSSPNFTLNKAFINQVLKKKNGRRLSLGEIMCLTKQSTALSSDRNKLNFALIGDPALKLNHPDYQIRITSINGKEIDPAAPDTLKALSQVSMQGQVLTPEGEVDNSFNGILYPSVFDSEETAYTQGNAGNDVFAYNEQNKVLYAGKASVKNGAFSFDFIVPKDISYSNRKGSVNLYAYSEDGRSEAQGVFKEFIVGGSNNEATIDSIGPTIRLFLNDTLFVEGGQTNAQPCLIAFLHDENGLNTSGNSIGHDIVLNIDNKEKFNLNQYYESDIDSYVSGMVKFVLPELSEGEHSITLKAWDMQNNSSTESLRFFVKKDLGPKISDIVFRQTEEMAYFVFGHDRPQVWTTAELRIYDLSGRLQWSHSQSMINGIGQSESIEWNYVGNSGRRVEEGLYICQLRILTDYGEEALISKKILVGAK